MQITVNNEEFTLLVDFASKCGALHRETHAVTPEEALDILRPFDTSQLGLGETQLITGERLTDDQIKIDVTPAFLNQLVRHINVMQPVIQSIQEDGIAPHSFSNVVNTAAGMPIEDGVVTVTLTVRDLPIQSDPTLVPTVNTIDFQVDADSFHFLETMHRHKWMDFIREPQIEGTTFTLKVQSELYGTIEFSQDDTAHIIRAFRELIANPTVPQSFQIIL